MFSLDAKHLVENKAYSLLTKYLVYKWSISVVD